MENYSIKKKILKFPNIIYLLVLLVSLFNIIRYLLCDDLCRSSFAYFNLFLYLVSLIGFIVNLKTTNKETKYMYFISYITIFFTLYSFELIKSYFQYQYELNSRAIDKTNIERMLNETSIKNNIKIDPRSKFEVILDFRKAGVNSYPSFSPINSIKKSNNQYDSILSYNGIPFVPLAGLAKVHTVACNERGDWWIYHSDRYGYNNPDMIWDLKKWDILFVGDSFTHGSCINGNFNIPDLVRTTFPNTANLGYGSTGPLLYLANIKEFGIHYRPKIVFFNFFEGNDLIGEEKFKKNNIIIKYLSPKFNQQLIKNNLKIQNALKLHLENLISLESSKIGVTQSTDNYVHPADIEKMFNKNFNINSIFSLKNSLNVSLKSEFLYPDLELFENTLIEAKKTVEGWGGKLVFVYLPDYKIEGDEYLNFVRKNTLQIVSKHKIQTINILEELINDNKSATFLYDNLNTHFSINGYNYVNLKVLAWLKNFPLN
jgi:hypothetical protein